MKLSIYNTRDCSINIHPLTLLLIPGGDSTVNSRKTLSFGHVAGLE
jgi:hypothetical protein